MSKLLDGQWCVRDKTGHKRQDVAREMRNGVRETRDETGRKRRDRLRETTDGVQETRQARGMRDERSVEI